MIYVCRHCGKRSHNSVYNTAGGTISFCSAECSLLWSEKRNKELKKNK